MKKQMKKWRNAPLVGPERLCSLGDTFLQAEIRKKVEAKRSRFWKETEQLRQAIELLRDFEQLVQGSQNPLQEDAQVADWIPQGTPQFTWNRRRCSLQIPWG